MITNSKQTWEVGETVKIGFLTLRITAKEPTPGDHMPDAYILTNSRGDRHYRFVPHYGLERLLHKPDGSTYGSVPQRTN